MKHAIRITTILAAAAFAACFGAGPEPAPPGIAKIVFSVGPEDTSNNTCAWKYFGDVAWGSDVGYTTIVPYAENSCNNNGGNTLPNSPIDVFQFPKGGGVPTKIGSAGSTSGMSGPTIDPRVVAADGIGSGAIWAFSTSPNGPGNVSVSTIGNPSLFALNTDQPVALHAANGYVFVATAPGGGPAINYPGFPCCQGGGSPGQQTIAALNAGSAAFPSNLSTNCGYASHCFASNSHVLFFFETIAPPVDVRSMPLPGTGSSGSGQMVATVPQGPYSTPVGLAADETNLIVATGPPLQTGSQVLLGCLIQHVDLSTGTHETLIDTVKFSCMDVELDGTEVYFAIVGITQGDNNNSGGNNNNTMHGEGIGRVDLGPGHAFESLALGFIGEGDGPRRLHIDGPTIFAIDPHVIGSLPKSALDNKHDFSTQ